MHASSLKNMQKCIDIYYSSLRTVRKEEILKIVDVGSADVNGTYRNLFDKNTNYIGVDMGCHKGVDLVISDPYKIPIQENFADLVISGQMLEHSEYFWLTFAEMIRILNHEGFLFLIAPSKGFIHRYPVDCYRFYPDAYKALAQLNNAILIDCWLDNESEWGDLTGVFIKSYRHGYVSYDTTKID